MPFKIWVPCAFLKRGSGGWHGITVGEASAEEVTRVVSYWSNHCPPDKDGDGELINATGSGTPLEALRKRLKEMGYDAIETREVDGQAVVITSDNPETTAPPEEEPRDTSGEQEPPLPPLPTQGGCLEELGCLGGGLLLLARLAVLVAILLYYH
jgi:hypothetical protein